MSTVDQQLEYLAARSTGLELLEQLYSRFIDYLFGAYRHCIAPRWRRMLHGLRNTLPLVAIDIERLSREVFYQVATQSVVGGPIVTTLCSSIS